MQDEEMSDEGDSPIHKDVRMAPVCMAERRVLRQHMDFDNDQILVEEDQLGGPFIMV